jgi:small-conductance mechanosensitive channel
MIVHCRGFIEVCAGVSIIQSGLIPPIPNKILRQSADWLMHKAPSRHFAILQTATLFTFIWYFFAIYVAIALIIKPPRELMLALMGSLIVATGIALKDIAASILSGLILLFERPFQVGDRVSFRGVNGEIVSIGLRSVRLTTLSDDLVTIPNAAFMTDTVSTGNSGALEMMVVNEFHLDLDADLEQAQSIIHEVLVTSLFIYLKRPMKFVVSEVIVGGRLAMNITAKAYVLDVRYEKEFQSDIYRRVNKLFVERKISRKTLALSVVPAL